jgi:hypothetical protein
VIFYEIISRKFAKQIADLLSDYDKARTGPCGGDDHLQNEKRRKTARVGGTGNTEAPASPRE